MSSAPALPTMIVVDDEEGPRTAVRMVFKSQFAVHAFDCSEAALEFVRDHAVHVAVLDLRIGRECGLDLLRRIKETDPRIEVVMLTAQETLETAKTAMRRGACDYLSKPFDLRSIREAVGRAHRLRCTTNTIEANSERLKALTEQLHEAFSREEMTRTANEIYAGVIHDINNPLAIIAGFVDLLQKRIGNTARLEGDSLLELRQHLQTIGKQVNTCCEISSRYLRFMSRVGRGPQRVPVNQVLADLEQLLRNHPAIKNSILVVDQLAEDAVSQLHATELMQALLNLAVNALQSTDAPQTLRISAELIARPLPVSTYVNGPGLRYIGLESLTNTAPFVAISVADQGAGIPEHVLPRIFETYFTTKAPGRGTGLGLSIVGRLVRSARGCIRVQTEPGRGTVMTVFLPAERIAPSPFEIDPLADDTEANLRR
ncbi:MAG TPA: response regulator [Opitutaceae bacterium]|nr:response regulator [Opitutaceae bacterium]